MYTRRDPSECRRRTMELLDEPLFCTLYETLNSITTEYGEPTPAELWDEAAARWRTLVTTERPQLAVALLKDELTEQYGERSAFLILMIMMYMLVALFRPGEDSPYHDCCAALAAATEGHPLLPRLWQGVRQKEDAEESAGRRIGIVKSLLAEMKAAGDVIDMNQIAASMKAVGCLPVQQHISMEVVGRKEVNIGNNYGPNIDNHDGGMLGINK